MSKSLLNTHARLVNEGGINGGDLLRSRVIATIVNGELRYRESTCFGEAGGMCLEIDRQG